MSDGIVWEDISFADYKRMKGTACKVRRLQAIGASEPWVYQLAIQKQQPCGGCEKLRKLVQDAVDAGRYDLQWIIDTLAQPCQQPKEHPLKEWAIEHTAGQQPASEPDRDRITEQARDLCRLQSAITGKEVGKPGWSATIGQLCEMVEQMRKGAESVIKSQPTPTVAKIAVDVEQIAREVAQMSAVPKLTGVWKDRRPTDKDNMDTAEKLVAAIHVCISKGQMAQAEYIVRQAITAALAPLQAERDAIEHAACDDIATIKRLQAELEQAKEEASCCKKHYDLAFQEVKLLQSRLATAEADTKRLDWLERCGYAVALPSKAAWYFDPYAQTVAGPLREAIDQAKGGA